MDFPFDWVVVPHGPEEKAVRRALAKVLRSPQVLGVPAGIAIQTALQNWQEKDRSILLVGLAGGLSSHCPVGDWTIARSCQVLSTGETRSFDPGLTDWLRDRLGHSTREVTALSSDRPICTATEKQTLYRQLGTEIVEMEAAGAIAAIGEIHRIAMLRVISDDARGDIPNLTDAIDDRGQLRPEGLAIAFAQQPLAAVRLIRGSLRGLRELERAIAQVFGPQEC